MAPTPYKGFEISSASHQLFNDGEWTLRVVIIKHHDSRGETLTKLFLGNNTFTSQVEANFHSVEFGKKIVDGQYPEFNIIDLL